MDTCFYTSYKNITNFMPIYFIELIQKYYIRNIDSIFIYFVYKYNRLHAKLIY